MTLEDLRNQVLQYIRKQCGGVDADPSAVPDELLEAARIEYGRHRPVLEVLPFSLSGDENLVQLPDVELVTVMAAYHMNLNRMGDNLIPPDGSGWPSLRFIDARFRDVFGPQLEFMELPEGVYIIREVEGARGYPDLTVGSDHYYHYHFEPGNYSVDPLEGALVIAKLPSWEQLPVSALTLLTKYAFSEWALQAVVQKNGLLRVPTGDGYFEYDGGKYVLMVANGMRDEFYNEVNVPTSALSKG